MKSNHELSQRNESRSGVGFRFGRTAGRLLGGMALGFLIIVSSGVMILAGMYHALNAKACWELAFTQESGTIAAKLHPAVVDGLYLLGDEPFAANQRARIRHHYANGTLIDLTEAHLFYACMYFSVATVLLLVDGIRDRALENRRSETG